MIHMRYWGILILMLIGCGPATESTPFSEVQIRAVQLDSISVRALKVMPGSVGFAGSHGVIGSLDLRDFSLRTARLENQGNNPELRAVASTSSDFFALSAGDPALLYKTGDQGQMELVYEERGAGVFYDAMAFWDEVNGIAVGDALEGCLSILLTRDGGYHWNKLPCELLPPALPEEGAFAASNSNIAMAGDSAWVISSKGRVYYTPDMGATWELQDTPSKPVSESEGLYSIDFYDNKQGYAIGGDYTNPQGNIGNKIATLDGGRTWELRASGRPTGYKSCVQYVPGRGGRDLVAVGFTGISYSSDAGNSWRTLSNEGFYSLRFINDSTAIASGRGRLAILGFR
jgi:photosystem II stability/assembly factor-like uncharacterized protein